MALPPLWPIAAPAAAAVAHRAIDAVEHLAQGRRFADLLAQPHAAQADSSHATRPPQIDRQRAQAVQALQRYAEKLRDLLAHRGIDTSWPIYLQASEQGPVQLANGHPDLVAIEQLFRDQPQLTAELQQLATQFASLRAWEPSQARGATQVRRVFLELLQDDVTLRVD